VEVFERPSVCYAFVMPPPPFLRLFSLSRDRGSGCRGHIGTTVVTRDHPITLFPYPHSHGSL
jgi:hypothetical protein